MARAYRHKQLKVCNDEYCPHEGALQPINQFLRYAPNADGHGGKCLTCRNARQRARQERINEGPWRASPNANLGIMVYSPFCISVGR